MNYLYSYNYKRARQNGAKFSLIGWLISRIDEWTHSEIRFSGMFRRVSFSCTNADKTHCCRFKLIKYSHRERWDVDQVPCSVQNEMKRILKACRLADVPFAELEKWLKTAKPGDVKFGKKAVKYDTWGTALSFISRLKIVKSSTTGQRCCEAVANVIMASDYMDIDPEEITPGDLRRAVRNRWNVG